MMRDDDFDEIRGALATLLDAEPPMRSGVVDDVRRGRALRHRRQRWAAGGVVSALVLGAAGLVGLPHLTGGTDQAPVARPAATSGAGWEIPAPVPGELGRVELPDGPASVTFEPVSELAYATALSCRSADPTARVVVDVRRGSSLVESTEARCDGTPVRNGGGTHYPEGGPLTLTVAAPAGAQAYAVVVPDLDERVAGELARATVPWSGVSGTARLAVDVPMAVYVSCLAKDPAAQMPFRVVAGRSGEGRTLLADTLRCDGSTSGNGFTYTATGEPWATIRLDAPRGATAFAILTQDTGAG